MHSNAAVSSTRRRRSSSASSASVRAGLHRAISAISLSINDNELLLGGDVHERYLPEPDEPKTIRAVR